MNFQSRGPDAAPGSAFTLTELLAILCTIALLALLVLPVLARDTDPSERAVCLNNVRRIMAAVAMYSTDNGDFMPHPSWGADLTGADNWCYATRLPTGQTAPSANGRSGPDAHTNQIPFYVAGQLAHFLESQRVLVCPTDWRESMSSKRLSYTGRAQKLTSYVMNGTMSGFTGPNCCRLPYGATYKTTDFLPTDILLWEVNDTDASTFNDAAENPEATSISRRHAASTGHGPGGVGRARRTADFLHAKTFSNALRTPRPNDLLRGPG